MKRIFLLITISLIVLTGYSQTYSDSLLINYSVATQTYSDSLLINYSVATQIDSGNFYNTAYNGTTIIKDKYSVYNYCNYGNSNGTIVAANVPTGVSSTCITGTTSISYIESKISGITENWVEVYVGIGNSSDTYDGNQYPTVTGTRMDTIIPYNNTSETYLGKIYIGDDGILDLKFYSDSSNYVLNYLRAYTFDSTAYVFDYRNTIDTLVTNSIASDTTKALFQRLRYWYGRRIISGYTGQSSDGQFETIETTAGVSPIIYNTDCNSLSEGYAYNWDNDLGRHVFGSVDNRQVDSAISHWNRGHIIAAQWHWYSPSGGHGNDTLGARGEVAGSTSFGNFNFDADSATIPGTDLYNWLIEDIDSIDSKFIAPLEAAGVPILFRPFHEAAGLWFWWGVSDTTLTKLWNIMYDRLVNYHGRTNLILVYAHAYPYKWWLVPLNKVDIIAFDWYPGSYDYSVPTEYINICRSQSGNKKMVALGETGPFPNMDSVVADDKMFSYFVGWGSSSISQNSTQNIIDQMNNTNVLTMDLGIWDTVITYCDTANTLVLDTVSVTGDDGTNSGAITMSVTGGISPYTYSWTGLDSAGISISNMPYGSYVFNVVDDSSCTASKLVTIPDISVQSDTAWLNFTGSTNVEGWDSIGIGTTSKTLSNMWTYTRVNSANAISTGSSTGPYETLVNSTCFYKSATTSGITFTISDLTVSDNVYYYAEVFMSRSGASDRPNKATITGETTDTASIDVGDNTEALYFYAIKPTSEGVLTFDIDTTQSASYSYINAVVLAKYDSIVASPCDTVNWVINDTVINPSCYPSNGSITINSVSGGLSPYSYLWNNGSTLRYITGTEGEYYVTITDANDCDTTLYYTIISPTAITRNATKTNVSCYGGSDASIRFVFSGGTPPYTLVSIKDFVADTTQIIDSIFNDTIEFYGLSATTYIFYNYDANGCYNSYNTTFTEPDSITITASVTNSTGTDGAIYISVSGGVEPYTYYWSNGETTQDISGLQPGTYSVIVTDNNGCSTDKSFYVGTDLPNSAVILIIDTDGSMIIDNSVLIIDFE